MCRRLRGCALFAVLLVLLAPVIAGATVLVLVQTNSGTLLAADGKMTLTQSNGEQTFHRACKIVVEADYAYAIVGTPMDDASGFNARRTIKAAYDPSLPLPKALNSVAEALRIELDRALRLLSLAPKSFPESYLHTIEGIELVFVKRRQNARPWSWWIRVMRNGPVRAPGFKVIVANVEDLSGMGFMTLGTDGAMKEAYDAGKVRPLPTDDTSTMLRKIREMVKIQASATRDVGLPVDAILMTREGTKWITSEAGCPPAQSSH